MSGKPATAPEQPERLDQHDRPRQSDRPEHRRPQQPPEPPAPPEHPSQPGPPPPPEAPRPPAPRRRWSLRTRLVVSAVALIAVVGAVIGTVTTIALHSYMQGLLDRQVRDFVMRAQMPRPHEPRRAQGGLDFVAMGGLPIGTVGAWVGPGGTAEAGAVLANPTGGPEEKLADLTAAQVAVLNRVPRDGRPHTAELPGLGHYRVESTKDGSLVLGLPLGYVQKTVGRLVVIEACVTAAGLVAVGLAGSAMVGIALRPLRRVAATATRVSELPLHQGDVALHVRVPASESDGRTEVGQVGAALNRMLGHVGSALSARQESETRVRRFVADASHELRTPLASIRGYAELTRRGREQPGPETRHALGRIESEAERMTGLVEDLLLLARLDSGRPLAYERIDLSPLVVDAVSDARVAGSGHRWRLELPDEPAVVYGDAGRLHQILVNLLANARTHTPEGTTVTARVRAATGAAAGDDGGVQLEVRDDGPGIPAELLPHVFERFARGDASRSRAAGSTGLGLAIVQAVVAAHGGTVGVGSVPGRTVFTVTLPAPKTQVTPPAAHSQHHHSLNTPP
ncbi:two-component sensor histidine kinase [Streptomyces glebosus]|uniref:histidine kinase n=1 Tax=Streptomyces glebosus TaxID=249580 RepID=A0A640SXL5_9ACTN|nr:HAMP domain-containing sensor histidine kinase [Streptomyces glebosus]GFE15622.1 two-component sensor histidine kinase [Streptomyces glebosus]GHG51735.1 two-component sensor histidine kinase [Streptomyces glebosus]